jgi:hypothetical protein
MIKQLKKFHKEHEIVVESPLGNASYKVISMTVWLKNKQVLNITDDFDEQEVLYVGLFNQTNNQKLLIKPDDVKKMSILKRQIKFSMKDDNILRMAY